jgi:prepilin-type N-terminal cleavage/methylation domain-containing protein
MIKQFSQKKRGFTLIETLVAISILMISIAGPMVLVGNGIRSSGFARDQVTAFYLAQDAIEAVRYIRDGNRIAKVTSSNPESVPWDDVTQFACTQVSPCGIDSEKVYGGDYDGGISTETDDDFLRIDGQGVYKYSNNSSDDLTNFKRSITITPVNSREVEIVVTVDWSSGIFTRRFSIRENLFYWY